MKKLLTVLLSTLLIVFSCFSLTACNTTPDDNGDKPTPPAPQTEIKFVEASSQMGALSNLITNTANASVVDASIFAHYAAPQGRFGNSSLKSLSQTAVSFSNKSYAFATKKDSNVALYLNAALYKLQQDGVIQTLAQGYYIDNYIATIPEPEVTFENLPVAEKDSAWANVIKTGYLKAGFVLGEDQSSDPFVNQSHLGSIDGFEIKLLVEVSKLFNLDYHDQYNSDDEFLHEQGAIVCNSHIQAFTKLDAGEVDVVINRMTEKVCENENVTLTSAFFNDTQVLVVTSDIENLDSLKNKTFTASKNSDGANYIKNNFNNYFFK